MNNKKYGKVLRVFWLVICTILMMKFGLFILVYVMSLDWTMRTLCNLLYITLHFITPYHIILYIRHVYHFMSCMIFVCVCLVFRVILCHVWYLCMFQHDTIAVQSHSVIMTCFISWAMWAVCMMDPWNVCNVNVNSNWS